MVFNDDVKKEIWRKTLHMGVILFLPIAAISKGLLVLLIVGLAMLYLLHESYRQNGGSIPFLTNALERAKRLREKEIPRAPFLMAAGVLVTVLIFPIKPAASGLMQLAFADMAAALIGMMWGSHKLPHSPDKSWEGSAAFFLMATVLTSLFYPVPESILLGLVGAAIESLPYKDWDNFFIPVGVAAVASFF